MAKQDRQPTRSITHLVKQVAKETLLENIHTIAEKLNGYGYPTERTVYKIDITEGIERVKSSCSKAGEYWTKEEDDILVREVQAAVNQIAANHSRSFGAIIARISQKDIIRS